MSSPLCFRPVRVQWLPAFFKKYVILHFNPHAPRKARLFGGCIAAVPVR